MHAEALMPILNRMLGGIKEALENTPPELSADLVDMGLTLTGGGALLKNIDKLISKETGLPVTLLMIHYRVLQLELEEL